MALFYGAANGVRVLARGIQMTIQAIPLTPVSDCLPQDASMLEALQVMLTHDINHIPICDAGKWLGLVSIESILRAILPVSATMEGGLADLAFAGDASNLLTSHLKDLAGRPLSGAVRQKVPILREATPLLEAALLLSRHDTPLPVLGPDGRLLGMLSRRAFLNYLVQQGGVK